MADLQAHGDLNALQESVMPHVLPGRAPMQLQLWVKNNRATCEAAARLQLCRGAPLYRCLPPFSPPPPTVTICDFSTNIRKRAGLLCCRLRATIIHRLAHGDNFPLPANCISRSHAQQLIAVLLTHDAAQRAPVFPPPVRVYYPYQTIPPPPPPPPPCTIWL
jgi:hypothetical protein